jgi:hypothetical protein
MWNYYILITEDMLSPDDFAKVWLPVERWWERSSGYKQPCYDTYKSILEGGEFHGGVTFYEKHQDPDTGFRRIKVGCDYGHLWDMEAGYPYDLNWVRHDALRTVEKLSKALRFKRRCWYTGKWEYPEEGIVHENGTYLSKEGADKLNAP